VTTEQISIIRLWDVLLVPLQGDITEKHAEQLNEEVPHGHALVRGRLERGGGDGARDHGRSSSTSPAWKSSTRHRRITRHRTQRRPHGLRACLDGKDRDVKRGATAR
jgi:hypothetical protein